MRKLLAVALLSATSVATAVRLSASPAATQNWVRNYVSTNETASASVSNGIVLVSKNAADGMTAVLWILENDTSTNAVQRAAQTLTDSLRPMVDSFCSRSVTFGK